MHRRFPPMRIRPLWLVAFVSMAVPLTFAAFTNHVWEDYLITLRSSRNLVLGNGLVFTPGERLHTFTSPLGVLVPAAFTWAVGAAHEATALWLFRVLSAGLLATGMVWTWRTLRAVGVKAFGAVTAIGLILSDPKLIDFASNGMETGILVFLVLALWSELERPAGTRSVAVGVYCGLLQWTRPDGFIVGLALLVPHTIFRGNLTAGSRLPLGSALKIALVALPLYAPWLLFATWYYGSPIPHTIIAKSAITPPVPWRSFLLTPWYSLTGRSSFQDLFLPTYWFYGGWPGGLRVFAWLFSTVAALVWLIPKLPAPTRRLSLAAFFGMFYVCWIILFPWYSPPWMAIAALAIGGTIDALLAWATARQYSALVSATRSVGAVAIAIQFSTFLATAWEMRTQQRAVENQVRHAIGDWLHDHATSGDSVMLEPLGYIGYYSQLKTFDYPGLSSVEVTAAIKSGARRFTEVIERVNPTWIVVRPFEIADNSKPENAIWRRYALVKTWNVHPVLDQVRFLPGRPWLDHDAEFLVFRRQPEKK